MTPIDKLLKLYYEIPWFFQKITPNVAPNDYILQLNQKTNTSFLRYSCPNALSLPFIQKYKEDLLFAFPVDTAGGRAFTSFFAIGDNMLMQVSPGMDKNENIVCGVSFHTNNPEKFVKMVEENAEFIIFDEPTAGFLK